MVIGIRLVPVQPWHKQAHVTQDTHHISSSSYILYVCTHASQHHTSSTCRTPWPPHLPQPYSAYFQQIGCLNFLCWALEDSLVPGLKAAVGAGFARRYSPTWGGLTIGGSISARFSFSHTVYVCRANTTEMLDS